MKVWSFTVIVLQGSFGCIPWSAMAFGTMFLQYSGVSDLTAGCISSVMLLCSSFGVLIGGYVGDHMNRSGAQERLRRLSARSPCTPFAYRWSRFHGRPITAQIATGVAVPTAVIFYTVLPRSPDP